MIKRQVIQLRLLRPEDKEHLKDVYAAQNEDAWVPLEFSLKGEIPEKAWNLKEDGRVVYAALADEQKFVGIATLHDYRSEDGSARIGLGVLPHWRRKGVGTGMIYALMRKAFGELDLRVLVAEVNPHNVASGALFETLRFSSSQNRETGHLRFTMSRERFLALAANAFYSSSAA